MNEQQEIDNYKDMIEDISNKCQKLHRTSDGTLCVDCQNELFRICQDVISNEGVELKIEKESSIKSQEMGTIRISQNTMNTFDLNVNDIAEIRSRSGGHTVAIVHEVKEENTIYTSFMTALNLRLAIPRNQRVKSVSTDVFMMRKIETNPATKITVEPKPGQYPVAGHYLTEKLKGVPIMGEDRSIIAPHPTYLNGVLLFLIRDVSVQTRSDKTIDAFYQIQDNDDKTVAAIIDSSTEFEIVNEVRGRGAFQLTPMRL